MTIYELHNNPYILNGYEDRHIIVPILAYHSVCIANRPIIECEPALAKDPHCAFNYALFQLEHRWEAGEPIILTSPLYSRLYATNILKRRWHEAEPIIATDAYNSYWYARDIIKGRFYQGESTMAKDRVCGHWYIVEVLGCIYPTKTEAELLDMMRNNISIIIN